MTDLTGHVALLTGATAGIGLEIANSFLDAGAVVAINGRGAVALAKLNHPKVVFVPGDCSEV